MITLLNNKRTRKKILVIITFLVFVRIGSLIPVPGVNTDFMKNLVSGSEFQFINTIMGNSLSHMSLFALSISPYITASIIIQLMTLVLPRIEDLSREGKSGQEKLQKIINYTGITIGFIQSLCMAVGFGMKGLFITYSLQSVLLATCVWTMGSAILIILSEKITKLDMGNGVSYVLMLNILSALSTDVIVVFERLCINNTMFQIVVCISIVVFAFALLVAVSVFLNVSEKRIAIKFSRKRANEEIVDYLPIPMNICNVMPVIFTGSILGLLSLLSVLTNNNILRTISTYLTQTNWFQLHNLQYTIGVFVYIALVFYFAHFYLDVTFNSDEIAYRLKQQGATIPGIRPGITTAEYLKENANKIMIFGNIIVLAIVLGTVFVCNILNIGILSVGGTSMLIVTNVVIDNYKKIKVTAQSIKSSSYVRTNKKQSSLFRVKGVRHAK